MGNELMISVVVPVYNVAPELERCVSSILAQTYQNLEVILVDDGSIDDSLAVMHRLSNADSRVVALHKENGGVTSARLFGVEAARGEWIGFVDGDDEIEPDMYERLLNNARQYGTDISHCGYRMCFADGRVNYFHNTGIVLEQDRKKGLMDLLEGTLVEPGLCNKLYRRGLFSDIAQQIDTSIRINEDLLMNFFLFQKAGRSVFEDFCPYHYIVRSTSASRQKLNEHRIFDPIRVKEIILQAASAEIRPAAERALISTLVNVYNTLTLIEGFVEEKQEVRRMILTNWSLVKLLSVRRRILAGAIRYLPKAYPIIYGFYAEKFQKNPYQ